MQRWWHETFASLYQPRFRVLWLGTLFGSMGLWTSIVARGFLTYDLTDSAAALGLIYFGLGAPLLLTPLGGILADRLSRKPVVVIAQASFAITNGAIAVLILGGALEFWMLFLASFAEGVGLAIGVPARQALTGDLVHDDDVGNGMALQVVALAAPRVVMPSIAGVLIAIDFIGMGWTHVLLAAFYASAALTFLRLPAVAPRLAVAGSFIDGLTSGISYVRSRPSLLTIMLIGFAIQLTVLPYFAFLPVYIEDVIGAIADQGTSVHLGVFTTAVAAGAFAASLAAANVADRGHAWTVHVVSTVLFAVLLVLLAVGPAVVERAVVSIRPSLEDATLLGMALRPAFVAALVIGVVLGVAEMGFFSLQLSLSLKYSHGDYYGRVHGVLLLGWALNGWAGLPIGIVADVIGVRPTFALLGVAGAVAALAVLSWGVRRGARDDAYSPTERLAGARPGSDAAATSSG